MKINLLHIIGFFVGFILMMFLLFTLQGCNTSKSLVDKSTIVKTDSVRTETIYIHDTIKITTNVYIKDSTYTDTQSATRITFNGDGGSYNTTTGEATGVIYVEDSKTIKALQEVTERWMEDYQALESYNETLMDSISTLNQHNDITDVKESKSSWYWWLVIGAIAGVTLVIFLKKFPYTKPLMIWL